MPQITDFKIENVDIIEDTSIPEGSLERFRLNLSFSFIKNDQDESGYELFRVLDGEVETIGKFLDVKSLENIDDRFSVLEYDVSHNLNYNENLRFIRNVSFYIDESFWGKTFSFYLKVYKKTGSFFYIQNVVDWVTYTLPPKKINDFISYYNGYSFVLEWSKPYGESLVSYDVLFTKMREIFNVKLPDNYKFLTSCLFFSKDFKIGDYVVVFNTLKRCYWSGVVTYSGEFFISNSNLFNTLSYFDYLSFGSENYRFFKCSFSDFRVFQENIDKDITTTFFNSDDMLPNDVFAFCLRVNGGNKTFISNYSFSTVVDVVNTQPSPYSLIESLNPAYGNLFFLAARQALVDENYYNKETYALPYIEYPGGTLQLDYFSTIETGGYYNIRGFTGVFNATITLYVRSGSYSLSFEAVTDKKGEYSIDFNCPEKEFNVSITGSVLGRGFLPYQEVPFYKLFAYVHFGMMSRITTRVLDAIKFVAEQKVIKFCSPKVLQTYYGNLISLNPVVPFESSYDQLNTEVEIDKFNKYRKQVEFLFPLVYRNSYSGSVALFNEILDYYKDNDFGIHSYEFIESGDVFNNLYNSLILNESLLVEDGSLENKKYTYYVTHVNGGRESYPQSVYFDYRIFNAPNVTTYPPIGLIWDSVGDTSSIYRVYRQENNGPILYLGNSTGISFIDDGKVTPNSSYMFPSFGYMDIPAVKRLRFVNTGLLLDWLMTESKGNILILVLYEKNSGDIPQYILDRIYFILRSILSREVYLQIKKFTI